MPQCRYGTTVTGHLPARTSRTASEPMKRCPACVDAPTTIAPELLAADGANAAVWTWRGQGFALVGDLDGPSLLKIAKDLFDPPAAAVQIVPERGS